MSSVYLIVHVMFAIYAVNFFSSFMPWFAQSERGLVWLDAIFGIALLVGVIVLRKYKE